MAIQRTNIHLMRVVHQIERLLLNMQWDMIHNAIEHKAFAVVQVPLDDWVKDGVPQKGLRAMVQDVALKYLSLLQNITDLRNDPARRARLQTILATIGWSEADITDFAAALRPVAIALRDAPRTTYAEIITACDAVLAVVDPLDSLWPE